MRDNNVNPLFVNIIGFMAGGKVEPLSRSDDQIIEEMQAHNKEVLAKVHKEGQTIFSRKHYITIDTEETK